MDYDVLANKLSGMISPGGGEAELCSVVCQELEELGYELSVDGFGSVHTKTGSKTHFIAGADSAAFMISGVDDEGRGVMGLIGTEDADIFLGKRLELTDKTFGSIRKYDDSGDEPYYRFVSESGEAPRRGAIGTFESLPVMNDRDGFYFPENAPHAGIFLLLCTACETSADFSVVCQSRILKRGIFTAAGHGGANRIVGIDVVCDEKYSDADVYIPIMAKKRMMDPQLSAQLLACAEGCGLKAKLLPVFDQAVPAAYCAFSEGARSVCAAIFAAHNNGVNGRIYLSGEVVSKAVDFLSAAALL